MTKRRRKKSIPNARGGGPNRHRAEKAGALRIDAAGAYHCETVLAVLAGRGALAPKNRDLNELLLRAGERYSKHWELGYRIGVAAQDINRVRSDGAGGGNAAEGAVYHAQQYRRASKCLGPFFSAVVDAVVLNEEPVESVGRRVSGHGDRSMAIAVAMDRLREGLSRLSILWGTSMLDAVRTESHIPSHLPDSRPDGSNPSRALRTHRTLAGMR